MRQRGAIVLGVLTAGAMLTSAVLGSPVGTREIAWLTVVLPLFPVIAWFSGALSSSVWAMRAQAREERRALETRVEELSGLVAPLKPAGRAGPGSARRSLGIAQDGRTSGVL